MNDATATDARARGIHPDDAARRQKLEVLNPAILEPAESTTDDDQGQGQEKAVDIVNRFSEPKPPRQRAVLVGDRLFPSTKEAARFLGVTRQSVAATLRYSPDGYEHDGVRVAYAEKVENGRPRVDIINSTPDPGTTDAADNQGYVVTMINQASVRSLINQVDNINLIPETTPEKGSVTTFSEPTTDAADNQVDNVNLISDTTLALLADYAAREGLSPDAALLRLLPKSVPLAAVLSAVDTAVLAGLSEVDWQQLRAIAAAPARR